MIWVSPVLFGLKVVSLIGIPGDDVIGTGADPLGWTALDELQLHRLLNGPS